MLNKSYMSQESVKDIFRRNLILYKCYMSAERVKIIYISAEFQYYSQVYKSKILN